MDKPVLRKTLNLDMELVKRIKRCKGANVSDKIRRLILVGLETVEK